MATNANQTTRIIFIRKRDLCNRVYNSSKCCNAINKGTCKASMDIANLTFTCHGRHPSSMENNPNKGKKPDHGLAEKKVNLAAAEAEAKEIGGDSEIKIPVNKNNGRPTLFAKQ